MKNKEIVVVSGSRTPFGSFGGSLKDVSVTDLSQIVFKETLNRSGLHPEKIDDVIVGNVIQSSSNAAYFARHAALNCGIGVHVPAKVVNRLCGSGMEAIIEACKSIICDDRQFVMAGGAENMSQAPFISRNTRWGCRLGNSMLEDSLMEALYDQYCQTVMGITAENLAEKYKISREQQDLFAARSQKLAEEANKSGRLKKEIAEVKLPQKKGDFLLFNHDEYIKGEESSAKLAYLKPVFKRDGTVTPGNASGINDGAGALIIADFASAQRESTPIIAKIRSWAVSGVEPQLMGIGPVDAIKQALKNAGLTMADIGLIEVNEAFAAQFLAVEKELGLDRNITNVNGGAIAIGHPLGASGSRVALTLLYEMKARDVKFGIASLCIGGGQGIAMVFENAS